MISGDKCYVLTVKWKKVASYREDQMPFATNKGKDGETVRSEKKFPDKFYVTKIVGGFEVWYKDKAKLEAFAKGRLKNSYTMKLLAEQCAECAMFKICKFEACDKPLEGV